VAADERELRSSGTDGICGMKIKPFLYLSRTPHLMLDLAAPALCAVLWYGRLPDAFTTALSLLTAFAGYTGVYALNDVMGSAIDREKLRYAATDSGYAIESGALRHPLARGHISSAAGTGWMAGWLFIAAIGAWILNPVILVILAAAVLVEVAYCRLFTITHWRFLLSGLVKSSGPIAAIFVVDSEPSRPLLLLVFVWIFFWELGGQNIPADWNDREEDLKTGGKTIPIALGEETAGRIALLSTLIATGLGALFFWIMTGSGLHAALAALSGGFLLIKPAQALTGPRVSPDSPARLFTLASCYPLLLLVLFLTLSAIQSIFNGGI